MNKLFCLICLIGVCNSYKYLVYSPLFAQSHANFIGRIADTLVEAGHEVTVLLTVIDDHLENSTGIHSNAKQIKVEQEPRLRQMMIDHKTGVMTDLWTNEMDAKLFMEAAYNGTLYHAYACETIFSNPQLLDTLNKEKFDVGIAEPLSICGFVLFDQLQIPAHITVISFAQNEGISSMIGEPLAPSYVPSLISSNGEKMGFFARLINGIVAVVAYLFGDRMVRPEAEILHKKFGFDYSNRISELIAQSSFVFVNSNPYLNYPRPLIAKTVEVGGIGVNLDNMGELEEKWSAVLDERPHTVFISFGSMMKSKNMPNSMKNSLVRLFESMPNVTFIWKYEEPTNLVDHLPNVYLDKWLPQRALLADPRLSLFVTHGGLGSTTEVAHFGKPTVIIPCFGDQYRNSDMLARHGGALVRTKADIENPEYMRETIRDMLENDSYSKSAKRLSQMLLEQPISAKDLVVSHSEFAAKFGRLPNLDPYGRHLSFIQYYLLDAIAIIFTAIFFFLFAIYASCRKLIYRICAVTKHEKVE